MRSVGHASEASPDRYGQLDALRGVAALVVVFNHAIQVVPESVRGLQAYQGGLLNPASWYTPWPWLRATPLRLIVDGHAAVDLFFVLSGFVLALTVSAAAQPETVGFLLKRVCRVYLPFMVVTCLAVLLFHVIPHQAAPGSSLWSQHLVSNVTDPVAHLPGVLLMTGTPSDMVLNPVMWTLVHEMRISLVMPLLFFALRRAGAVPTVLACLAVSLAASLGLEDSATGSWLATGHFLWMFAAGSVLSINRAELARWASGLGRLAYGGLFGAALLLMAVPFDRLWSDFLIATGAALLLALCLTGSRVGQVLNTATPRWLGRISYSLYLVHMPILIALLSVGHSSLFILLPTALVAAEIAHRLIEAPSHRLGVALTRMSKGLATRENKPAGPTKPA